MTMLSEAWFSTIEHLNQFQQILNTKAPSIRWTCRYPIPDGFPYLRITLIPWSRFPVICLARGRLAISDDRIEFTSMTARGLLSRYVNLRTDLSFSIARKEIESVVTYVREATNTARDSYRFPWTRIRTTETGLHSDFLIGLGGRGPSMEAIHQRNQQLLQSLISWQQARRT